MTTLTDIQRFEPFHALDEESRKLLARGLARKECGRAEVALHKGQPVSGAYVVLSGRLRVFALAANGTEATLYFIEPGETCVLALNYLFNDLLYGQVRVGRVLDQVQHNPGALLVGGGALVEAKGQTIGGIGVSGAPPGGSERDSIDGACAMAGLVAIQGDLEMAD